MASIFNFCVDYGAASTPPERGLNRITGQGNVNWKNLDDPTVAYSAYPITAGQNSFDFNLFGMWSGTFNQITSVKFQHVSGTPTAGISLFLGTGSSGFYRTPAITSNSTLTIDFSSTGNISTGVTVFVGAVGPEQTGKNASCTVSPTYSQYLTTQKRTASSTAAGDDQGVHFGITWLES
jgi:hypothetical protein